MSQYSSKAETLSVVEPTMLLAITPSMLASLGISLGSLADYGVATLHHGAFNSICSEVKVLTFTSNVDAVGDVNRELLTADAMAQRMQCSRANVYDREKKGTLFSVLPPGRENGRRYPAFQLHPRLDSVLLNELIVKFKESDSSTNSLWDFMRAVNPSLGGLTGVEILTGQFPNRIGVDPAVVTDLKNLSAEKRRAYVVDHALEGLSYAP